MRPTESALGIRSAIEVHKDSQRLLRRGLVPGMRVLDVGCGDGSLIQELRDAGMDAVGVEIDPLRVRECVARGLDVRLGRAEALPFRNESIDAVVCCVVVPYTDQRQAVREWSRVLRPGGSANATYHAPGYGVHYLLAPPEGFRSRFYGARMLVNTGIYAVTGRRIPGFLGDTLCQTDRAMRRCCHACGLQVDDSQVLDRALGVPRIIFHAMRKGIEPSAVPD